MTKRVKQVLCLVLALAMFAAFGMTAMAAVIEIESAIEGATYSAYKVFDVTVSTGGSYSTTIEYDSPWFSVVQSYISTYSVSPYETGLSLVANASGGNEYTVVIDTSIFNDTEAARFAAYLKTAYDADPDSFASTLGGTATGVAAQGTGDVTATIDNLDAGYYFVTTTVGTVCMLTNASGDSQSIVTIKEKNEEPSVDKTTSTDGTNYEDYGSATIGDTVYYQLEITIGDIDTTQDIQVVDTLPDGLTYNNNLSVTASVNGSDVPWTEGTQYAADYDSSTNQLTIDIYSTGLSTLVNDGDKIIVTYQAILNDEAAITSIITTANPNTNSVTLTYGNSLEVTDSSDVYTYRFALMKTDGSNAQLEGAEFTLEDSDGNLIRFIKVDYTSVNGNSNYSYYRVATEEECDTYDTWVANGSLAADNPGYVVLDSVTTTSTHTRLYFLGLGEGEYTLTEVTAPAGYNPLQDPITVTITQTAADGSAMITFAGGSGDTYSEYAAGVVQIVNASGSELPSTGGIGTTIFYIVGAALMIGAAVVLITRRRMRNN